MYHERYKGKNTPSFPPIRETPPAEHEAKIFAAELGESPTIDLHGRTVDEAKLELEYFLFHEFKKGTEVVKIITGNGTEKLRDAVGMMLTDHPLVAASRPSGNLHEQDSVTYAVLERKPSTL